MHKLSKRLLGQCHSSKLHWCVSEVTAHCSIHHTTHHARPAEWHSTKTDFLEYPHRTTLPNEDPSSSAALLFMALAIAERGNDKF